MRPTPRLGRWLLAALAATLLAGITTTAAADSSARELRVQLKWYHQAQFAGFYTADDQGYFAERDLEVTLTPGVPGENPLQRLVDGDADVAEGSMDQAVAVSQAGTTVVNIAQLFQNSDSVLICRTRPGLASAQDLASATVSVGDRRSIVEEMFDAMFGGGAEERYVPPRPFIEALTRGGADCQWGSTFNEYWRAEAAGLDVFVITPEELGVVNIEDGLYVREDRLGDPEFRRSLVDLLIALERGWEFAALHPSSTVMLVRGQDPTLEAEGQRQQLEAVLPLFGDRFGFFDITRENTSGTPRSQRCTRCDRFGYFDIARFETVDGNGVPTLPDALRDRLWTHDIFNATQDELGQAPFVTPVTRHYIEVLRASPWYRWMMRFGVVAAALAGALTGARLGYRFWGRLVLATLTALGGGVLRDILLGGDRYPSYLVHDPSDLYLVLGTAVAVTALQHVRARSGSLDRLDRAAQRADVVGFSVLAVNGATVAIVAGATLIWVPIAAALTVAGGGILTDVLTRREHEGFRGHVYEEAAVIGALTLLAGLAVANRHEHRPILVLGSVLLSLAVLFALRISIHRFGLRYPRWGAHRADTHADVDAPLPDQPASGAAHSGEYGLYANSQR